MAWDAKDTSTQLTNITTEQFFDDVITLNPGEVAHCQVSVDFPTTPTDHAIVAVYTTLDDSTETWDIVPIQEYRLANSPDPNRLSFQVGDVYRFRVGVRRSGSTDTLTSADMGYRTNGVDL